MYTKDGQLYIAHSENGPVCMLGQMANRHGLIAGATGTGKTVSLQVMAESFSQAGIPCFMADMKGDLSGISQSGNLSDFIKKRCTEFGLESPVFAGCPTRFLDVFGEKGHPLRTTISEMGPQLLSRLLNLNNTQSGILNIVFRIADDQHLLLIDMKDLRSLLDYVCKNARQYTSSYGNITTQSVGAIQRALIELENQGADFFFGEPAFDIQDLIACENGKGVMNVLAADRLMLNPVLYSTFLLWLLSELYTQLPEVGDQPLPKLVFFFDEAHTLFKDTSPTLVDKVEQVVRLIRSKGVGVYFVTQLPTDIPEAILGQLGNRVQHALRAFTPKDQKNVRATAETFRKNPTFNTEEVLMELGTGEALVSLLDEKGAPSIVQRTKMMFPLSSIGPITALQRTEIIRHSRLYGIYDKAFDRESAYEQLEDLKKEQKELTPANNEKTVREKEVKKSSSSRRASPWERAIGAAASTLGRQITNTIVRGLLGNIFKGKR